MFGPLIFHIDVNSAFLSWTALSLLENGSQTDIRLIPSIIGGDTSKRHGVVFAKSIPAKDYGIQTGEPVINAYRKCKHLVSYPPQHELYDRKSRQLMEYLENINPNIEQVSIDECYMDYSPIAHKYTSPEECAHFIKDSVYEKFGFTVNIGISDRKVLAKMASDFKKPNLVHTLYAEEIPDKLWPLPVSSLYMCGRSSSEVLRKLGLLTIGDLAESDPAILESHLKSHGITLWSYANGIDDSTVIPEPSKVKGIGNSTTLWSDARSREDALPVIMQLAQSVSSRLKEAHELAGNVCVEIKYATFRSVSHQVTFDIPFSSAETLYQKACILFDEMWDGTPIRLLGVRTSRLIPEGEPMQLSLFDLMAQKNSPKISEAEAEKRKKLESALLSIRNRYGDDSIKKGSDLHLP